MKRSIFNCSVSLHNAGFVERRDITFLMHSTGCESIPDQPGVYMVVKNWSEKSFLESTAGMSLGKRDEKVTPEYLDQQWVENTFVLYIGKAVNLRRRIRQYMNFGSRRGKNHAGGRLIWWIRGYHRLLIFYKTLPPGVSPRDKERVLLVKFEHQYGKLPFANLQH